MINFNINAKRTRFIDKLKDFGKTGHYQEAKFLFDGRENRSKKSITSSIQTNSVRL